MGLIGGPARLDQCGRADLVANARPFLSLFSPRVKSLVREFDQIAPILASPSPPVSPDPASSSPFAHTHVRRAASVSYSSTSLLLSSPSLGFNPAGLSSSNSMNKLSEGRNSQNAPIGAMHKRKGSRDISQIMIPDSQSGSLVEGRTLEGVQEEIYDADGGQVDGEDKGEDAFVPLPSPSSTVPFTVRPNGTTPTTPSFPRGADHARKHSRIHERNLSAFFPRPGQQGVGYGDTYEDPTGAGRTGGVSEIPLASAGGGWGAPREGQTTDDAAARSKRRGHHHKHSVSHNFFSFLDPTQTNSDLSLSPKLNTLSTFAPPTPLSAQGVPSNYLPSPSHSVRSKYAHLPSPIRFLLLVTMYLPLGTQLALALSLAQIVLGATLWITGQSGESLAVTGLGYLVVFDGMGGLSGVLVEGGKGIEGLWSLLGGAKPDSGVRLPFG
jgi:hypothetical protein